MTVYHFEIVFCCCITFLLTKSIAFLEKPTRRSTVRTSVVNNAGGYFKLPDDNDSLQYSYFQDNGGDPQESPGKVQKRIIRQLINAFDNLPASEVELMFEKLSVNLGSSSSTSIERLNLIKKLKEFTILAENIEDEAERRLESQNSNVSMEDLEDSIRVIRSQLRMYAKDAEFYDEFGEKLPNSDGTSALMIALKSLKWPWNDS